MVMPSGTYGMVDSKDTLPVDIWGINGAAVTGDGSATPWDAA